MKLNHDLSAVNISLESFNTYELTQKQKFPTPNSVYVGAGLTDQTPPNLKKGKGGQGVKGGQSGQEKGMEVAKQTLGK